MVFNFPANYRKALPRAFAECDCAECNSQREVKKKEILSRQVKLIGSSTRRWGLIISPDVLQPREDSSKGVSERRALRLPDEIVLQIFQCSTDMVDSICLALTCKQFLSVYATVRDELDYASGKKLRSAQNIGWSNHGKDSKIRLINLLAEGWVRKVHCRFCWACLRFQDYGPASQGLWERKLAEKACCQKVVDGKKKTLKQCKSNWEVKLWTGRDELKWLVGVGMMDERIRCPGCVLRNFPTRITLSREDRQKAVREGQAAHRGSMIGSQDRKIRKIVVRVLKAAATAAQGSPTYPPTLTWHTAQAEREALKAKADALITVIRDSVASISATICETTSWEGTSGKAASSKDA